MSRSFTVAVTLNFISTACNGFTVFVSTVILSLLIKSVTYNTDISLLLFTNCYIGIVGSSLIFLITSIDIIKGDYEIYVGQETIACRIQGYMIYVLFAASMNAFALQALFRFCCIFYSTNVWLKKRSTYLILILILWIVSFVLMLPVHIWFDVKLIAGENVCLISTKSARGLIWCLVGIYGLPMIILNTVYLKLTCYLRKTPVIVSASIKRDITVIRRIVSILTILSIIGTPTIILMVMLIFTKVGEPLYYRISTMTISVTLSILSIALIYTSPQFKDIVTKLFRKNRVTSLNIQHENEQTIATNIKPNAWNINLTRNH